MLTKLSCQAVLTATDELTRRGIVLSPVGDTPLQLLTDASTALKVKENITGHGTSSLNSFPVEEEVEPLIRNAATLDFTGVNIHDHILQEYVDLAATAVATSVDVARNEVNPMTEKLIENVNGSIERASVKKDAFNILVVHQPTLMKNSAFDEITSRYRDGTPAIAHFIGPDWPEMSAEKLRTAATCNIRRISADLEKFLEGVEDDEIVGVYEWSFRQRPYAYYINDTLVSILTYFWAETWLKEIPEGVLGNLESVRGNLITAVARSGWNVQKVMGNFARAMKYNNFILRMPTRDNRSKPIEVSGEVYNNWLKEGGSPELLIGAALTGSRPNFAISESERKHWTRAYNADIRAQEYILNTRIKEAVTVGVRQFFVDELEEYSVEAQAEAREILNAVLDARPYRTDIDLQQWAREIICEVFFSESNARNILDGIDEIMSKDKSITQREAATFAALDVMADYLVSMMVADYV